MLGNRHVFWQAFVVASVIFWLGILIGANFERSRVETVEDFYFDSQSDVLDFELSSNIFTNLEFDCNTLNEKGILLADKIYAEALKLEKYDNSNKLTKELISLHRRYDILRTSLWMDLVSSKEKCSDKINTIIYFYQYRNPSLTTRANQGTMSNFLIDLKAKYGDKIILIPIAVDTNVESLNSLREYYKLNTIPVVFVNEKYKFENIESLKDIEKYLI